MHVTEQSVWDTGGNSSQAGGGDALAFDPLEKRTGAESPQAMSGSEARADGARGATDGSV